jgi:hypothetical protein
MLPPPEKKSSKNPLTQPQKEKDEAPSWNSVSMIVGISTKNTKGAMSKSLPQGIRTH